MVASVRISTRFTLRQIQWGVQNGPITKKITEVYL